jgi:hypothetical protein
MDNSSTDKYDIGRPVAFDLNGTMFAADGGLIDREVPEPGVERTRATTARAQMRPPPEPEHRCMARKWISVNGDGQCSQKRTCGEFCTIHAKPWNLTKKHFGADRARLVAFMESNGVPHSKQMTMDELYQIERVNRKEYAQWMYLGRVDEEPVPWKGSQHVWLYTVGEYGPCTNQSSDIATHVAWCGTHIHFE